MSEQTLHLDLSVNASARSRGQARRRQQPAQSDEERRGQRNAVRRDRAKQKREMTLNSLSLTNKGLGAWFADRLLDLSKAPKVPALYGLKEQISSSHLNMSCLDLSNTQQASAPIAKAPTILSHLVTPTTSDSGSEHQNLELNAQTDRPLSFCSACLSRPEISANCPHSDQLSQPFDVELLLLLAKTPLSSTIFSLARKGHVTCLHWKGTLEDGTSVKLDSGIRCPSSESVFPPFANKQFDNGSRRVCVGFTSQLETRFHLSVSHRDPERLLVRFIEVDRSTWTIFNDWRWLISCVSAKVSCRKDVKTFDWCLHHFEAADSCIIDLRQDVRAARMSKAGVTYPVLKLLMMLLFHDRSKDLSPTAVSNILICEINMSEIDSFIVEDDHGNKAPSLETLRIHYKALRTEGSTKDASPGLRSFRVYASKQGWKALESLCSLDARFFEYR